MPLAILKAQSCEALKTCVCGFFLSFMLFIVLFVSKVYKTFLVRLTNESDLQTNRTYKHAPGNRGLQKLLIFWKIVETTYHRIAWKTTSEHKFCMQKCSIRGRGRMARLVQVDRKPLATQIL